MPDHKDLPLTGPEVGSLWMTYQKMTMLLQMMKHFAQTSETPGYHQFLAGQVGEIQSFAEEIRNIFTGDGIIIPVGFTDQDVDLDAPALYNDVFGVSWFRIMTKVMMGMSVLHLGEATRDDVISYYERNLTYAKKMYIASTKLLMENSAFAPGPVVTPPQEVEFVQSKSYMSGTSLFQKTRPINTVEVLYLHQGIEINQVGAELMTGFAQAAREPDVQQYFARGKNLAYSCIDTFAAILKESDIQPAMSPWGRTTRSTRAPFSDKLMMYCTNLLSGFSLGSNAIGTSFSMRTDLPMKMTLIAAQIYDFAKDGGKLMVKYKWMEEPFQAEDRAALLKT
ncbi:DUF3231 family protein [Paenibacillus sp.]|uniref:DUF3231 family protein n=1 Tax=Paenibacillus sp. TaxID=58172 RepID=UPI002D25FB5B|nr:DUF3231 family protein [Paenibacillus sp.]HZG56118.1 DUF3231 family protein [Paenibacillus sp.]